MTQPSRWSAELESGPFDGATVDLDLGSTDLPRAVIVTFVAGEPPSDVAGHSYVLDRVRRAFRYLGEDRDLGAGSRSDAGLGASVGVSPSSTLPTTGSRSFYDVLFERHAQIRPMFADDIRPQAAMLGKGLRALLEHFGDADWLITELGELGARHARWGVTAPMYDAFSECMLAAMSELSGDDWTAEAAAAWTATFDEVRDLMLDGAMRATGGGDGGSGL